MDTTGRVVSSVLLAAALAVGCAYHAPASPTGSTDSSSPTPNMTPTTIRVSASSRTDQTIDVTAIVLSGDGHYVPNVPLTFALDAGTISPTTATTDANGAARANAATPSSTTLHVSGGGVTTAATLPASVPAAVTDAIILNVPGSGVTGVPVTMFVSSAGPGPWSWTFGDGQTLQTSSLSTQHTYGRPGTYPVSVSSGSATASGSVTISDPAPGPSTPTPSISAAIECTPATHGSPTGCHATMTDVDGSSLTANINKTQWDWGDGKISTSEPGTPGAPLASVGIYSYPIPGSYVVVAHVYTTGGQTATAQTTVKIP